ncbi:MAG: hypothetical protein HYU71_08765 [Bacteroidetes bacterium]|nr:hypothetical protein [Bacteroidota bacterium]
MKRLIIEIQKGGLGDHLFYSHLPRIAKESGAFSEVYISDHSIFRNEQNRQLIWESNPYINGFTSERGIYHLPETLEAGQNLLDHIMLAYGMDDGKRFHEPEVYYKPAQKKELADAVIYDPNYISYTGDLANGQPIEQWFTQNGEMVHYQMKQLNNRYLPIHTALDTLAAESLFDLCSILVSARQVYCLNTGTATLAAALGVPVTVFYGTGLESRYRHSRLHRYVHLGSNYGPIDLAKKWVTVFLRKFIPMGTP